MQIIHRETLVQTNNLWMVLHHNHKNLDFVFNDIDPHNLVLKANMIDTIKLGKCV